ncbi:MAG: hypothetical protein A2010_18520 [Nitrospirae bacterium GWD2_57_9]|nr:MAG: hypothetical protein A2010_18520 [Nitrospirae bacterium GWD2_57_9]OGW50771.1 MAG: hypothetical protein A2078_05715 [Nitrospirae bacterium GWC2_57_9]
MRILIGSLLVLILILLPGFAFACSLLQQEKTFVGSRPAIKGICSNNGMPAICLFREGTGVECDGPSGGYTGYDLYSLIFSACGCSSEEENELWLRKELEKK